MILDSIINFAPVLGVVWNWIKKIVSTRVGMFLVLKGTLFFSFLNIYLFFLVSSINGFMTLVSPR